MILHVHMYFITQFEFGIATITVYIDNLNLIRTLEEI